ncbi:acyl-CoA dehydrogenase [Acidocella aquatica]|uniref:Acyl-CoA dehydrogenase n=1 Tax=Acidocella aquatica TaxID=1922313 RepID=A0ABQ6A6X3_9PROT|nr:acyl-CoA dehydrogenase family protein [Acidocella aquatica]GLR67033.1 acyl-CoA dehydrogenase [Acidocella aquatica]
MELGVEGRAIFREDHNQFRKTVRIFFRREIEPNLKEWEKAGMFDPGLFKKAAEYGILQAGIPVEYGGMGGDFLHHAILHEEHGYNAAGASMGGGLGIDGSSYVIWAGGTDEQKREWLPRYASGDCIAEACFTEPQSGSDVAGFRTFAKQDGDDYIVNGSKVWTTNGSMCTMLPTVLKTEMGDGTVGMSIVLIDTDMPGVHVTKGIETLHRGCANEAEVFFEDVRVPRERLLGGRPGGGFKQVMSVLNDMRVVEASRFLAAAELAFSLTVAYVKDRKAFGQRIFDFQNTQFRLADIKTEIAVNRAFVDQCLVKAIEGSLTSVESSMAKLSASELEFRTVDQCLQLHGGMGYAHAMPISQIWTQARVHRILLGTSEIHRLAIGRSI